MAPIVVGFDGSGCGNEALDAALDLAAGLGDEVLAVFGYAPPGIWGGEIAEHEEAISELGDKLMGEARDRASGTSVSFNTELIPKRAVEALLDTAKEKSARMIVVGGYGESPVKGALLGSTPYKLLHQTEVPVLVVPAPDAA